MTLLKHYQPVAAVMGDFIKQLRTESKSTPYPSAELHRALRGY
jgi:hypothetical protein